AKQSTGEADAVPSADWRWRPLRADGSEFEILHGNKVWPVRWSLLGRHNMANATAAVAAAAHAGVPPDAACAALASFRGVKRRLELLGDFGGVRLYDDFAHHPTAIRSTLEGLRATLNEAHSSGRVIVLVEARSNTMKAGHHQHTLAASFDPADEVLWFRSPQAQLDLEAIAREVKGGFQAFDSSEAMIEALVPVVRAGDHVVVMSNGGFE